MLLPDDIQTQLSTSAQTLSLLESLSSREQALCWLTVALSLEDGSLLREALIHAKRVEVSNEEMSALSALVLTLHARKLSRLVSGGQPLPQARITPSASSCCQ